MTSWESDDWEKSHPLYNEKAHGDGEIVTGHYESDGMCWEYGEIPECNYCDATPEKQELYETHTSGILICGKGECASMYVAEMFECMPVRFVDDGEAPCVLCEESTDAKGKEEWLCDECEEDNAEECYVDEMVKIESEK